MSSFPALRAGNGVGVAGLAGMGDLFVDARVRAETGSAAYAATRATSFGQLESTIAEPGDLGVSNALQQFWAGWEEVGNNPGCSVMRDMLIDDASVLTERIAAGHRATVTQWQQTRTELDAAIVDVGCSAAAVANLNQAIRGVVVSGGSANGLIDRRRALVTGLCALVGASAVQGADGTVDVMVGGNALVRGDKPGAIAVSPGAHVLGQAVTLTWGDGDPFTVESGALAGLLTTLTPTAGGHGGILAEAGARYDALTTTLLNQVNAQHARGRTAAGTPGGAIFASRPTAGGYSAADLAVAITDPAAIAVGAPGGGSLDGSMGDAMAQLGSSPTGPDAQWTAFVADLGVSSRSAMNRATITEATRRAAEDQQMSSSSLDVDEEAVSMLAYQHAYEGAARVLTTIDSMHDALINRTGPAGR